MLRLDASKADCLVFTYKEGLLSPVAHDLKLKVSRFEIEINERDSTDRTNPWAGRAVTGRFDATSLHAVCAVKGGQDSPSLSSKDLADIDHNIATEVLETRRYPEIRFVSTGIEPRGSGFVMQGTLTLKSRQRAVRVEVQRLRDLVIAECSLHQPDFGIKPFSALLGTLRIKPEVKIRLEVPEDALVGIN